MVFYCHSLLASAIASLRFFGEACIYSTGMVARSSSSFSSCGFIESDRCVARQCRLMWLSMPKFFIIVHAATLLMGNTRPCILCSFR